MAYLDKNGNGTLGKNFMGIPRESLGLSNNYQPKGPPSFQQAAISVAPGRTEPVDDDYVVQGFGALTYNF